MEELSRPVTLTELAAALGGACSVHFQQDAPWLNSLQNAQFWHPEMQRYGRETLLILPHTSSPETLEALASHLTSGDPRAWALCGWSDLEIAKLPLSGTRHSVLLAPLVSDATRVVIELSRLTHPPSLTELRRLTNLQRTFSQALEHPNAGDELLRRLQKVTNAVCLVVDQQGRVRESIGSLPLSLFWEQIRRTDAATQHVSVEGWEGQALRLKPADPNQPQSGGWLIVAARRANFPDSQDIAAAHIAATLLEAARRMQLSAEQQETAIRASVFDEALALSTQPDSPELASRLGALGIDFDAPLRVLAVSATGHPLATSRSAILLVQQAVRSMLEAEDIPFLSTSRDGTVIYLVQTGIETIARLKRINRETFSSLLFGIGRGVTSVGDIQSAYADALIAIRTMQAGRHNENLMSFEQFDFATRVFASVGLDRMVQSSRSFLGPILDREPMLVALRRYFENDQNTNETADALGIHHNTLRYRLGKVEELLEVKLNDPSAIASLFLALTSLDLVEIHSAKRMKNQQNDFLVQDEGLTISGIPKRPLRGASAAFISANRPPKSRGY